MGVAWPFGSWQKLSDWTGWDGSRTSGMGGSYCNGTRNSTHSGAEYNARDLNQKQGLDYGIVAYAGIAGKIMYAGWQDGYGYTVVIYDKSRHVALRYAHLSVIAVSVNTQVSVGSYIGKTGNSGLSTGSHLHIVGYENINDNNSNPIIPTLCDSDYYACAIYFYTW